MKHYLEELSATLKPDLSIIAQKRDELKLQLHLGSQEAEDAWHRLNAQYESLKQEVAVASVVAENKINQEVEKVDESIERAKSRFSAMSAKLSEEFDSLKRSINDA